MRLALVSLFVASTAVADSQVVEQHAEPSLPGPFSVSAGIHTATVRAGDDAVGFTGAAMAARYRAWRGLELELALASAPEHGAYSSLAMHSVAVAARYRILQERSVNGWLLAGIGGASIAREDATAGQLVHAERLLVTAGAGIEYRFTNLALQIEGRVLGLGRTTADDRRAAQTQMETPRVHATTLTVGASFYFGGE